jgi:hypothetical protein
MNIEQALPEYKKKSYRTLGAYWQVKAREYFEQLCTGAPEINESFLAEEALAIVLHNKSRDGI